MANTEIHLGLNTITTNYTQFENDQVLTADQLNSVARYADSQIRLNRTRLVGVGIVCGLDVSLSTNGQEVHLTRGVGITTDGDLLGFAQDKLFDRFRVYDETRPKYAPFYTNNGETEVLKPVYELMEKGAAVDGGSPLTQFQTDTSKPLLSMVGVLLMEGYINDPDLCSGTDCDNQGQQVIQTQTLVLVDVDTASTLFSTTLMTKNSWSRLTPIQVHRVVVTNALKSSFDLQKLYTNACGKVHAAIMKAFNGLRAAINDVFPVMDANLQIMETRLAAVANLYGEDYRGTLAIAQYYYDFLNDVATAYNELWRQLCGGSGICIPEVSWFPKHLVLGRLNSGEPTIRTGFFPSIQSSCGCCDLGQARLLLVRLHEMIGTFTSPTALLDRRRRGVRITPSYDEDRPLAERAIPYYYESEIRHYWRFMQQPHENADHIYSYHGREYGPEETAAKDPLDFRIAQYPFFRIEGHLGRDVKDAFDEIHTLIRTKKLPFAVRAILIGGTVGDLYAKDRNHAGDLARMYNIEQQKTLHELRDVRAYCLDLKDSIRKEVGTTDVELSPVGLNMIDTQVEIITNRIDEVELELAKPLSDRLLSPKPAVRYEDHPTAYQRADKDIRIAVATVMTVAAPVMIAHYSSPADTQITQSRLTGLQLIEQELRDSTKHTLSRELYSEFVNEHAGLEHSGGVVRGGTFVLVYDAKQTVVADFMLPYLCCEPEAAPASQPIREPNEPETGPPIWRSQPPKRFQKSRRQYIRETLDNDYKKPQDEKFGELAKKVDAGILNISQATLKIVEQNTMSAMTASKRPVVSDESVFRANLVRETAQIIELQLKKLDDPLLPSTDPRRAEIKEQLGKDFSSLEQRTVEFAKRLSEQPDGSITQAEMDDHIRLLKESIKILPSERRELFTTNMKNTVRSGRNTMVKNSIVNG